MTYRVGVDVGGTFTDCVLLRPDGTLVLEKSPTTPEDQSLGVLNGIAQLAEAEGLEGSEALLRQTESIVHGTTAADNAMIQMRGANTGLIVTRGFRDEIELRRCYKEDIWDPAYPAPQPIAKRRVRLEVDERMTAEGEIETPLDEEAVRAAARRLKAFGVTSIAVVFIHSYVNPVHEKRARELILQAFPEVELISLSHEVYPKPPEFERTSTTLVNAFVGPPIVRYLDRLEKRLADTGFSRELLLATSSGGVATPDNIRQRALATISSGPTGGVVAAARAAADAGMGDVISVDMGGTSYDVCLIRDGKPDIKSDWNWRHRYCIALPMVDVVSVGAGGGSIARSRDGQLTVGPDSAGSQPGPVCYRRGGTEPTVTDADLLCGRLDPAGFWGGRLSLDVDGARAAVGRVGEAVQLGIDEAAVAIIAIIDAHMCDGIRRALSLAGADPRQLDLVAFGGMGAVHAVEHARELGMKRVLVPQAAPAMSALGLLTADHLLDDARALLADWRNIDLDRLSGLAAELEADAIQQLEAAGVAPELRRFEWMLNMVYPGQTFDTAIPVTKGIGASLSRDALLASVEEFHRRNEATRLVEARSQEPVIRGIRLVASGLVDQPKLSEVVSQADAMEPIGKRRLYSGGAWHEEAPVYSGERLGHGDSVTGPALIQSRFTTLVMGAGDVANVLKNGDILVEVAPR
ncbi:hydantoinase/oxoprolinase family protein [Sphingomonas bacterium]|uniref:hydantoinase/oxoprolinase family protein n=1 Tax=Sphingomonas bacterium TaxID=1895847 RepID=UPI0015765CD4|nr:hydantoinase/oxoprolinase family protein [Sphingomonas bacterium]